MRVFDLRWRLRRLVIGSAGATIVSIMVGACGRSASAPIVRTPAPTPTPMVVATPTPLPVRTLVARTVTDRRFAVRSTATVERDSAGRTESQRIETRAVVQMSAQRADDGTLRGVGRVDSFTVRITGAGTSAPKTPDVFVPIQFDAVLDATSVRVTARPPLVNECDRPEAGATTLVHDLLLRIPASVVKGDTWRDSTSSVFCRAGIPITVRATHDYRVETIFLATGGSAGSGSVVEEPMLIVRTTSTRIDGKAGTAWRSLELAGTGTGFDEIYIDAVSGAMQRLEGNHTLTLQVTERGRSTPFRSQRVTQRTVLHAETQR